MILLFSTDSVQIVYRWPLPNGNEKFMSYRSSVTVNFVSAIFQRFFPLSALGPVLRALHIVQEPTGLFPRPSFLAPWHY